MICLDTQVIIWGIKKEANSKQEPMIGRTKNYIEHQHNQGLTFMVPAPVVAESLIRGTVDQLRSVREIIEKSFFIPAFDSPSAFLAAELERSREVGTLINGEGAPREHIRIDTQIAAIAITQKAELIVSHDKYMKRIAQGYIQVIEVPDIPVQETLQLPE